MTITQPKLQLFPKAIIKRREAWPNNTSYLSDWQVHSAHLTAVAIRSVADDNSFEVGPIYVPMPTGSGKTTGAIWGIVDCAREYPDLKICFLTPYKDSVDVVYRELASTLGEAEVGHYHSDANVNKGEELAKRIVVLTHAFIEPNKGALDDRGLFIIDEAIYATGEASLKLQHFSEARSWATSHGLFGEEFTALLDFATDLDRKLRTSGENYIAAPHTPDMTWAETIVNDFNVSDHYQNMDNKDVLYGAQRFCEALLNRLVFLSKGSQAKGRHDPVFSAAVLGIPRIDKAVILSATGGMVYEIAGPFKESHATKNYWTAPSFENLNIVQLSGPKISDQYRNWGPHKDKIISYLDWLLATIPEQSIYLTLPKLIIDKCLRHYFGESDRGDLDYPLNVNLHGKNIYIANHARSVGSNDFKDCNAIVYLWENHIPQAVSVQRFHTLADEAITDDSLQDANSGKLVGNYQRIKEAQYIDNMVQHIGRGSVRSISEKAVAGKMTAYILAENSNRFTRLVAQYRDCHTSVFEYGNIGVTKPTGRIERIIDYLRQKGGKQDVPATVIEKALGFRLSGYRHDLQNSWDIMMLGYSYHAGGKGRGNTAKFLSNKTL